MLVYVCFYILIFAGDALSGSHNPQHDQTEPWCPENEYYTRNNPRCIRTCANKWVPISEDCKPFTGCVCDGELMRLHDDGSGPCVPENKCPYTDDPKKPEDRVYTAHAESIAYAEAAQEKTISDCDGKSISRTSSKSSSFSKSSSYTSVVSSNCGNKCSDPNEVYKDRPSACPLTCANPNPGPCNKMQINKGGCECAEGFVRNEDTGRCVRPIDCPEPISCPRHSHYVINDNQCPKTCGNRLLPNSDVAGACVPFTGCACKPGYVRKNDNATEPCIKEIKCPPIPTQCGVNEVRTSCAIVCPPQTCESIFSKYYCLPTECEPGCDCQNGFLRNKSGVCIPSEDCFKSDPIECGLNEVYSDCAITCPPQSCESLYTTYLCAESTCAPGCNCIDGYLRNSLGDCVPSQECYNDPGGCNGDLNATRVRGCGSPSRPTCENPEPEANDDICVLNGCECKPGYILSCDNGNCIEFKDCPGGPPKCGANQTYVGCLFGCPNNFCPADDSRAQVACSMPYPCKGGCACKAGYLIVSHENRRCILASDCPEVKCKRPNEMWDPDPSGCFSERCDNRGSQCDYPNPSGPRCVCKKGFYRNDSDICIPVAECPPLSCNGDFNATLTVCPNNCPKTCDDPYAGDDGCIEICGPTDCQCKPGYFLTKLDGGKCIKPEDCESCKGDPNARYSYCPSACEPTCRNKDRNQVCTRQCMPPGCVCRDGYVLNEETGKCTKPERCPSGCGGDANAEYSTCPTACERTCDNLDPQICTLQCLPPGCVCKPGFVKSKDGKCIKPETCPGCKGDPNARYSYCPSACEPTCRNKDRNQVCTRQCMPPGCVCRDGYVLNEETGKCTKPERCPSGCGGDANAEYSTCPTACERTCDNLDPQICTLQCLPPGCVCKPGFVKSKDGKCIKPETCPGCKGDPNARYSYCPSACEPTCRNKDRNQACTRQCMPPGCVCRDGYVLNEETGKCTKPERCPSGCGGDANAEYSTCPTACERTCDNLDPQICTLQCLPPGCVCKPGFVKSKDGKCIKPETCPVIDKGCNGDLNATQSDCPSSCPPTCENRNSEEKMFCPAVCDPSGCVCKQGFILTKKGGKCVLPQDCPVPSCEDSNAMYKNCPSACEPTCLKPDPKLCTEQCMPPGCVCKPDYVLNEKTGKCVKRENCPADCGCNGDMNATYSDCTSHCPTTCADRYGGGETMYCPAVCGPPGCVCKPDYILTEKGGLCILPEDCPVQGCGGDLNAVYSTCPSACEPTCDNQNPQICTMQCLPPGCVCKPGFVKSKDGKCIKPESCPVQGCGGDLNAVYSTCPSACEPTCDNQNPQICTTQCLPPGCVCKPGFVKSKDGKCIKPESCPAEPQCKGDRNATYTNNPSYCQGTCKNPDPEGQCMDMPKPPGCVCKPGYILRRKGGPCIKPEDCPGGWPTCRGNKTYVHCKVSCPNGICPVDDSLDIIACDPIYPCFGGCACKEGYLIVSQDDNRCVLSSECQKVECKRPYEVWDPNAPGCLHERCDDKNIPCDFPYSGPPRCRCIEGYYRNQDNICVPECQCSKQGCNGDLNATFSNCPSKCPPTCCKPDRRCDADCDNPGCVCNDGFILSKPGGHCISPYDCDGGSPHCRENMTYTSCEFDCPMKHCPEDENEIFMICDPVWPCPSGCECKAGYLKTNTGNKTCILAKDCPPVECTGRNEVWNSTPSSCNFERCDEMYYTCDDPTSGRPKCVCKEGYYRDSDGVCIPAEECPKPKPICGYNEVAVPCRQICPPQNCEIAYTDYACTEESKICEPGCDCLPDHLRNGSGICIPNDQCPYPSTPVCGVNEIARDCRRICPPQTCLSKYALFRCAEDLPCEPGCDCVPNYLRDERGICIPSEKCPAPCPITEECKRTCGRPNPQNCVYNPPKVNMKGCDCIEGYVLSELGGDCIPIEQCPPDIACHGDPNARPKRCPKPCPSTCQSPNQFPCKRMCEAIGCECKPGFLLSNNTDSARCILPDKCPGGNPCGKGGRFADCKTDCKGDYCPVDDSRDPVYCESSERDCLSGCICDLNYKRKSREDPRCIMASTCRRVNCTRPNEKWSSCPSACLAENCEDIYNQPTVCNALVLNCEPRCICEENYFRNSSGICVHAKKCPPPGCGGDEHAVYSDCPSACEPTCDNSDPQICTDQCMPAGCVCKQGFVLNKKDGKCITRENCPVPDCKDPNAVYKECTSACEPTCTNRKPQWCTDQCMPAGCVCKEGFVLNEKDGKCTEPCNCPDY